MNKYKIEQRKIFDERYSIYPGEECVYCGNKAEVYDHVPPLAIVGSTDCTHWKYPSCEECNLILNSYPKTNLNDRRACIIKRLKQRHRKILSVPDWEECDLREFDCLLQKYIKASIELKSIVNQKLKRLNAG